MSVWRCGEAEMVALAHDMPKDDIYHLPSPGIDTIKQGEVCQVTTSRGYYPPGNQTVGSENSP